MDALKKLWDKIKGWKVYILGVGAILTAIGTFMNGTIDAKTMGEMIWAALVAMGLRHGITTTVSDATNKKL